MCVYECVVRNVCVVCRVVCACVTACVMCARAYVSQIQFTLELTDSNM